MNERLGYHIYTLSINHSLKETYFDDKSWRDEQYFVFRNWNLYTNVASRTMRKYVKKRRRNRIWTSWSMTCTWLRRILQSMQWFTTSWLRQLLILVGIYITRWNKKSLVKLFCGLLRDVQIIYDMIIWLLYCCVDFLDGCKIVQKK